MLAKEKEVLNKAQEEVKSADKYVKKIEDKKLKDQADKVKSTYEKRHDSFNKMYDSYDKSLKQEKELYTMLQDKGTKLKDISEKVKVVNQSYKDIESEKDKFNEFTKSYNTEKVAFINKQILKLKRTVWPTLGQTVLFLYKYDYTMEQVHLIFSCFNASGQYNLELFLPLLKIRLFSDFDRRIQDDQDAVEFENLLS